MAIDGENLFTDELWACISPGVIDNIKAHPFITGLVDGSLKDEIFRYPDEPHHLAPTHDAVIVLKHPRLHALFMNDC